MARASGRVLRVTEFNPNTMRITVALFLLLVGRLFLAHFDVTPKPLFRVDSLSNDVFRRLVPTSTTYGTVPYDLPAGMKLDSFPYSFLLTVQ